jgi:hypothetical protein
MLHFTLRQLLLACTALISISPAAMAGGVRDPVPTRTAVPPPAPPVTVHATQFSIPATVIPGQLYVSCHGFTIGSPLVFGGFSAIYTVTDVPVPVMQR